VRFRVRFVLALRFGVRDFACAEVEDEILFLVIEIEKSDHVVNRVPVDRARSEV
jgi:hypothetical protein